MSGRDPSKEIQEDQRIQSYSAPNSVERQTSMSVGYLTRTPHNRDHPPYDINNNNFIYSQSLMQQPPPNMPQQPHRESYDRPPSGNPHTGSTQSTSSNASPHPASQQTPRITLPPLSAITENQETPADGTAAQSSQPVPVSPAQTSYSSQQQQQTSQPQQPQPQQPLQHQQQSQQQAPPQPSPTYPPRPSSQYELQQGAYPHQSRHLQASPQLPPDQSRYTGPVMPPQVQVQQHQMPVTQMQPNQQMGQFSSPSQQGHFPPQSQYAYQQSQYPPQPMYGQYPPHQMPPQMPPGIPYQPAYATSHRQRPPQFNPYPPPNSGFAPPPQGAPQGWPQQDYIAQPLTQINAHSPQQGYSPQLQQMQAVPGGPMRVRRTSSGLGQSTYPPPGEPPQSQSQPQSSLKPKRKRATSGQLRVLNSVFASTFFPSTELRIALGKELNMSPRTVQIWFQNKRQSWRAHKAKTEHGTPTQTGGQTEATASSQTFPAAGSYSPHPLRQEQHFTASPTHGRMPSTAEESGREEGMENDEGGGWEALRQAQQANRDYRPGMPGVEQDDDVGFDDEIHEHRHHR